MPDPKVDNDDAPQKGKNGISRLDRHLGLWWVSLLVFAAFAGTYTTLAQADQGRALSHFDEFQYYDYLTKLPDQGFIRQGEEIGNEARQVASCDGFRYFGQVPVQCGSVPQEPDSLFPGGGLNSADIYTPAYFAPTWLVAQVFTWAGADLLDAGRAVGGFWLLLGLWATFYLQVRLGVRPTVAVGTTLLILALPATYWGTQFISTDAPSYAVVAALGLVAVRFAQGRGRLWELPALSALAVAFKVNNLAGVGMAMIALLAFALLNSRSRQLGPEEHRSPFELRRALLVSAASTVAAVLTYGGWLLVRMATSLGPSPDIDSMNKVAFTPEVLLNEMFRFLPDVGGIDLPNPSGFWPSLMGTVYPVLGIGALAVALVANGRRSKEHRAVGIGVGSTILLFGPLLSLMLVAVAGYYVMLSGRYGIVFVVAYAVLIGMVDLQRRWRAGLVLGAGVVAALITMVLL